MRVLFLFILFMITSISQAEYRAHLLSVRNLETGSERQVISTLDQMQYAEYYPVKPGEAVFYMTSWRCPGRTSYFKPICANPKDGASAEPTANSTPGRLPAQAP